MFVKTYLLMLLIGLRDFNTLQLELSNIGSALERKIILFPVTETEIETCM